MALTAQHIWTAIEIDTRMRKLPRSDKDAMAIMLAMVDHMPAFRKLIDTAQPEDLDELARRFPGFHEYTEVLEVVAAGIQSGEIDVPQ